MSKPLHLSSLILALLLAGCNAASVQPQPVQADVEQAGAEQADAAQVAAAQTPARTATGNPTQNANPSNRTAGANRPPMPPSRADFEQLAGRFTLVQEQLLQLVSRSAQLQEQNQRILLQLQGVQAELGRLSQQQSGPAETDTSALDAALEQLMLVANSIGAPVGVAGDFRVASTYTPQGEWVLIRYDRVTGETWLADQGQWQPLQETGMLEPAIYSVTLVPAGKDLKGYAAARVDRNNGRIWWLKQTTWQLYGE
ncbi:hypothetical protein [Marinobacterium arenosum]|uniref:hypothetical protein n=1 Tax=Marinobacterium arenosum TaxID=2862496 RepID=UPI001C96F938|nr:hypothetical protein [Marinobacterium arenosum]MBY4677680.1 hypothetical protein [Marinobacterium arenosum]